MNLHRLFVFLERVWTALVSYTSAASSRYGQASDLQMERLQDQYSALAAPSSVPERVSLGPQLRLAEYRLLPTTIAVLFSSRTVYLPIPVPGTDVISPLRELVFDFHHVLVGNALSQA